MIRGRRGGVFRPHRKARRGGSVCGESGTNDSQVCTNYQRGALAVPETGDIFLLAINTVLPLPTHQSVVLPAMVFRWCSVCLEVVHQPKQEKIGLFGCVRCRHFLIHRSSKTFLATTWRTSTAESVRKMKPARSVRNADERFLVVFLLSGNGLRCDGDVNTVLLSGLPFSRCCLNSSRSASRSRESEQRMSWWKNFCASPRRRGRSLRRSTMFERQSLKCERGEEIVRKPMRREGNWTEN